MFLFQFSLFRSDLSRCGGQPAHDVPPLDVVHQDWQNKRTERGKKKRIINDTSKPQRRTAGNKMFAWVSSVLEVTSIFWFSYSYLFFFFFFTTGTVVYRMLCDTFTACISCDYLFFVVVFWRVLLSQQQWSERRRKKKKKILLVFFSSSSLASLIWFFFFTVQETPETHAKVNSLHIH